MITFLLSLFISHSCKKQSYTDELTHKPDIENGDFPSNPNPIITCQKNMNSKSESMLLSTNSA